MAASVAGRTAEALSSDAIEQVRCESDSSQMVRILGNTTTTAGITTLIWDLSVSADCTAEYISVKESRRSGASSELAAPRGQSKSNMR